jgi:hypothetical protein
VSHDALLAQLSDQLFEVLTRELALLPGARYAFGRAYLDAPMGARGRARDPPIVTLRLHHLREFQRVTQTLVLDNRPLIPFTTSLAAFDVRPRDRRHGRQRAFDLRDSGHHDRLIEPSTE